MIIRRHVKSVSFLDDGDEPRWALMLDCNHSAAVIPRVRRVGGKRFVEAPPRKARCGFCESVTPDEVFASADRPPSRGEAYTHDDGDETP